MISREGLRPLTGDKQERERKPGLAAVLKQQFRAVAKAIIQAIAPTPAKRRKRREETEGAFKLARTIARRVKRSIFPPLTLTHKLTAFDEAEYFLRRLFDEWAQEDQHHQPHEESFHYGSTADFDPHL